MRHGRVRTQTGTGGANVPGQGFFVRADGPLRCNGRASVCVGDQPMPGVPRRLLRCQRQCSPFVQGVHDRRGLPGSLLHGGLLRNATSRRRQQAIRRSGDGLYRRPRKQVPRMRLRVSRLSDRRRQPQQQQPISDRHPPRMHEPPVRHVDIDKCVYKLGSRLHVARRPTYSSTSVQGSASMASTSRQKPRTAHCASRRRPRPRARSHHGRRFQCERNFV